MKASARLGQHGWRCRRHETPQTTKGRRQALLVGPPDLLHRQRIEAASLGHGGGRPGGSDPAVGAAAPGPSAARLVARPWYLDSWCFPSPRSCSFVNTSDRNDRRRKRGNLRVHWNDGTVHADPAARRRQQERAGRVSFPRSSAAGCQAQQAIHVVLDSRQDQTVPTTAASGCFCPSQLVLRDNGIAMTGTFGCAPADARIQLDACGEDLRKPTGGRTVSEGMRP